MWLSHIPYPTVPSSFILYSCTSSFCICFCNWTVVLHHEWVCFSDLICLTYLANVCPCVFVVGKQDDVYLFLCIWRSRRWVAGDFSSASPRIFIPLLLNIMAIYIALLFHAMSVISWDEAQYFFNIAHAILEDRRIKKRERRLARSLA